MSYRAVSNVQSACYALAAVLLIASAHVGPRWLGWGAVPLIAAGVVLGVRNSGRLP